MTNQHRATDEQWAQIKKMAPTGDYSSCIIELRDRIQQLEAAQQSPSSQLLFKTETTYGEASDHARRLVRNANTSPITVEGSFDLGGKSYTYKGEAEPAPSSQPPTLAQRVARAINDEPFDSDAKARAVIREVVAWLNERDIETQNNPCCLEAPTADDAARWLSVESNR